VAVETARQLLAAGYAVDGVILIDSPSPVNHTPLPDSIIDAALNIYPHNSNSEVGQRVKEQIRMNTLLLARYDPAANAGPYPALALLRSTEPFRDATIEHIPDWLRERNPAQAAASWEMLAGAPVKVWEIPGNHFQTFHASNVCDMSSCFALILKFPALDRRGVSLYRPGLRLS
jgi:thioesterase domain-containing protein